MADGDSDDPEKDPYNRQAFTSWFQNKGPFDEIKGSVVEVADPSECTPSKGTMFDGVCMKWYCGCQQPGGVEQDATGFGLRLQATAMNWRFRCNDQPGFALCSPVIKED